MLFFFALCSPPYLFNYPEKINNICTYAVPCVIFFFVFENACNIERHLVTLNKFYEDDPYWAAEQLDGAKFIYEDQFVRSAVEVQETLHDDLDEKDDLSFSMDFLLDKIIHRSTRASRNQPLSTAPQHAVFKGLWPGQVLLARHLNDSGSKAFKKSIGAYMVTLGLVHVFILTALVCASLKEVEDARSLWHTNSRKGTLIAGGLYEELHTGYCRDDSMQRPDCYWIAFEESFLLQSNESSDGASTLSHSRKGKPARDHGSVLQPRISLRHAESGGSAAGFLATSHHTSIQQAVDRFLPWVSQKKSFPKERIDMCAGHCNSQSLCIGFSVSEAFCTIYTSKGTEAPPGWTKGAEAQARSASVRRSANIVQTSKYRMAECWKTAKPKGEPQDIVGCIVCLLHVFMVVYILVNVVINMWPKYGSGRWW
mmetsp:Transcript_3907/g.6416  ORF Transcript_3907/g.6416 Transcript_3907/m.6416 type:complete len:425 (+) Transcript_3907:2-1276(+)